MAWGDRGYISRLASVWMLDLPVPSHPRVATCAGGTRVLQSVQDRTVLEMSWSEKQRMIYLFLGCGEEHLLC